METPRGGGGFIPATLGRMGTPFPGVDDPPVRVFESRVTLTPTATDSPPGGIATRGCPLKLARAIVRGNCDDGDRVNHRYYLTCPALGVSGVGEPATRADTVTWAYGSPDIDTERIYVVH